MTQPVEAIVLIVQRSIDQIVLYKTDQTQINSAIECNHTELLKLEDDIRLECVKILTI